MSRARRVGAVAAGLVLLALATVPLRLVLRALPPPAGLSASDASGTPWQGRLHGVRWQGRPLGTLSVGLRPWSLPSGTRRVAVAAPELALWLLDGRLRGVDGATGGLALARVAAVGGLDLRIDLEDTQVLFDRTGCRAAGGTVGVMVTSPALPALALSGRPACDGERARLALAPSQAGPGAPDLTASLEIDRGGAWRIEALARSDDAGLRLALAAAGFQEAPGGLSFVASGRLDD